jgi:biotin-dependent carboxylase-like uncharacterized protein
MKPCLRVLGSGLLSSIQDLGRPGYQYLGISPSGALDPVSLHAANTLVGNAPGTGALEVAYLGPNLLAETDSVRLSVVGASAPLDILSDETARRGMRVETMRSFVLRRGEILRIGSLSESAVLYVAVEGGFDITPILGSVSTYKRGGMGGINGRALAVGDRLPLRRDRASERSERRIEIELRLPRRFRAVIGPQDDYFSAQALDHLFGSEYCVGAGSDRMGMRLQGPKLEHIRGYDILSDGIAPGSIQVPGNGQPIVLLTDRQTTGGYPKIATVISADLPALGRVPIGSRIRFEPVSLNAARAFRRKLFEQLEAIPDRIVILRPSESADIDTRLHHCNLISGAVNAHSWAERNP